MASSDQWLGYSFLDHNFYMQVQPNCEYCTMWDPWVIGVVGPEFIGGFVLCVFRAMGEYDRICFPDC